MANEYDISRAFKRIENELIDSMMRNMQRHQVEEADLGIEWEQWQAIQLAELEEYRKKHASLFTGDFKDINDSIEELFRNTATDAQAKEENALLDKIRKGQFRPPSQKGGFFGLNEGKLEALITATQADFIRAEYALLRQANDVYRKTIFDAMTYANVTNDYKKAVDMATHDFLKKGIACVQYKNGAMHNIASYAEMAIKTGNKRAYLMGEGNAHDKYGLHTVRVNRRTQACPKCVGFLGRLLIDDVYGGGTRAEATAQGIPTLSDAMQAGFLHPNCKDIYSAYIPGVSKPADPWTPGEIEDITDQYNLEQEIKHAQDTVDTYKRMAKYSLDPSNVTKYQARADEWQTRVGDLQAKLTALQTPAPPPPPPTTTYKATSASGKFGNGYTMKGLAYPTMGKGKSWQMKLNPNLDDMTEQIKATEALQGQVPNIETVLKIQYAKAIAKADEEYVKLKAKGAKLHEYSVLAKKKKAWQKKLDIIVTNEEVAKLESDILDLEANKLTALPADKTFSGIWKQDVKLSEYAQYESKISGKIDYYIDKIDEWQTKGVSVYGQSQAYVDAKVQELTQHMQDVIQYEQEGVQYKQIADQFNTAITAKQDELDQAKDKLDTLLHPKKKAKGGKIDYDDARRAKAPILTDEWESDKKLRPLVGKSWQRASQEERRALYDYTGGSGRFNHPLYWKEPLDKDTGYGTGWGDKIRDMTRMIDNAEELAEDMTVRRGTTEIELAQIGAFGKSRQEVEDLARRIPYMTEAEMRKEFVGKGGRINNFMSSSPTEGHGFFKQIDVQIFTPKGTKGVYAEPISAFGGSNQNGNQLRWDGISQAKSIGYEQEYIIQRGGWYEIVDIQSTGYGRFKVVYVHHPELGYERYGM